MARMTEAYIERSRRRLLGSLFLLLVAFSGALVLLSFLGSEIGNFFDVTPAVARLGFLALTLGLLALVWERERSYRKVIERLRQERLLSEGFRNRLDVMEALLKTGERLQAPLAVDEVLGVLLESAIDLTGAVGGTASLKGDLSGLEVAASSPPSPEWEERELQTIAIPLRSDSHVVAEIELMLPPDRQSHEAGLDVLDRFAGQAATTLERAGMARRERSALDHLRASQLVKSRFLATVSHELRTPLTSIIGFAQTLDHHWERLSEDRKHQAIGAIGTESHRLWRIVERMLDAARVELQGVTVKPREHDVRETVVSSLRPLLAREKNRIDFLLPTSEVRANLDPFVIDRVTSNLVDNALKYTDEGVHVVLHPETDHVTLRVQDGGPGLDGEALGMVTEPLFRVETNARSGTGLGLHVVRMLVQEHGGEFEIQSDRTGTVVTVRLPRRLDTYADTPQVVAHPA